MWVISKKAFAHRLPSWVPNWYCLSVYKHWGIQLWQSCKWIVFRSAWVILKIWLWFLPKCSSGSTWRETSLWLVADRFLCSFQTTGSPIISTHLFLKHGLILPAFFFFILSSENTKEQHLGSHYDGENVVLLQAVYCCSGTANVACRRKNCTNCN